ncbi:transcriptional repressor LexA [Wandonia haliotis]|uniref:Transcriptional repressor LexA n=1 Tax=Wandonia haliotis TaxID=574963 RepID=A0ABN1MM85_9FLAO
MKALHTKQSEILTLLKENSDNPLTIKDLSTAAGIDSPGVLYHHLRQLEKKGYLKRNPNNSKDYVVLDKPEASVVYVGKYGDAQCGPEGILLDESPEEYIPIASSLLRFPASEAFIVDAKGDSMEPKIYEGDVVIAKRQNSAENNDLVVCSYNERVMIKKLILGASGVGLYSLNSQKHPIISIDSSESFFIAGVVKNILSYNLR